MLEALVATETLIVKTQNWFLVFDTREESMLMKHHSKT